MLSESGSFLVLDQPCDEAVEWLVERVRQAGLSILCTFDFQVARQAQTACPCPHHGSAECDCQLVVFLIYQAKVQPLTMIAHGYNGRTWFSIVDTPQQRPEAGLKIALQRLFVALPSPGMDLSEHSS